MKQASFSIIRGKRYESKARTPSHTGSSDVLPLFPWHISKELIGRRCRSEHVAHVRRAGGVGVDHLLEIACPQARTDREGEEIDHLLGVLAEKVCPQDSVGALLDENLVAGVWEGHPLRGIPARGVPVVRGKVQALCASRWLK